MDPENAGPWKTWTLKNLDLELPGSWKNLDPEKAGTGKAWTLKDRDPE